MRWVLCLDVHAMSSEWRGSLIIKRYVPKKQLQQLQYAGCWESELQDVLFYNTELRMSSRGLGVSIFANLPTFVSHLV